MTVFELDFPVDPPKYCLLLNETRKLFPMMIIREEQYCDLILNTQFRLVETFPRNPPSSSSYFISGAFHCCFLDFWNNLTQNYQSPSSNPRRIWNLNVRPSKGWSSNLIILIFRTANAGIRHFVMEIWRGKLITSTREATAYNWRLPVF